MNRPETKASVVSTLLSRVFALFSGEQFRGVVDRFVRRNYAKGMEAEEVKLKLRFNVTPCEEKLKLMTENVQSEVNGVMSDLERQLQESIREGILNNEPPTMLKKRVQLLMNPTKKLKHEFASGRKMNWQNRIEMITRTEANRAQNQGHFDAFKESGLSGKKWISVHPDDRLCPICSKAGNMYDKENPIPIDDEFNITVAKARYRFQKPPIHVNCRCRLMFIVEEPEGDKND